MANGESSSQDSGPHYASINRPAMNQFRKQKVNAEIEGTATVNDAITSLCFKGFSPSF